LRLQQFRHRTPGGLCIPATLHQNVDDKAFLVDGPPDPAFLARYADDDLVEIPLVAEAAGGSAAYLSSEMPEAE
jgi:hypothetical protein